ncbi:MAG: DEAD/DEAH box helicase [Candidatus Cyclonatronum sp.]|uniref:SNF2-related protein n=1 Tax=Cyclonatronum sp. TaxID=3024185 RepID=UPI0025BB56F4|nr:SNF2-related protein [Cyclonatronum sp.]MCH8486568.1 DEAD/DEAH box helicase [Cyclonatronum sp.]
MLNRDDEYDPILLKLEGRILHSLHNAHIRCVEQLFGITEAQLVSIRGIGGKALKQLTDLLHNLPFDYMRHDLAPNPDQDPYLGLSEDVHTLMREFADFSYDNTISRGLSYFRNGRVLKITPENAEGKQFSAHVEGTDIYNVFIDLVPPAHQHKGRIKPVKTSRCSCPINASWKGSFFKCKHIVAAFLEIAMMQRLDRFERDGEQTVSLRRLNQLFKEPPLQKAAPDFTARVPLRYCLFYNSQVWNLLPETVYTAIQKIFVQTQNNRYVNFYKWNPWESARPQNSRDQIVLNFLKAIYHIEANPYSGNGVLISRSDEFTDILSLLERDEITVHHPLTDGQKAFVSGEKGQLLGRFSRTRHQNNEVQPDSLDLVFSILHAQTEIPVSECLLISRKPCWVYHDRKILEVNANEQTAMLISDNTAAEVTLGADELAGFFGDLFPRMQLHQVEFEFEDGLCAHKEVAPVPRLYLSEMAQALHITLRFAYENTETNGSSGSEMVFSGLIPQDGDNPSIQISSISRDMLSESQWINLLESGGIETGNDPQEYVVKKKPLEWVARKLPALVKAGFEVYGEEALKKYARPKKMTSKKFQISSGMDWFELSGTLNFEGQELSMSDIEQVLVPGTTYVKLADGGTGELPKSWLERIRKLLHLTEAGKDKARVPKIMAAQLDELLGEADEVETDAAFESYAERLRSFDRIGEVPAPKGFQGSLRPYQLAGLSWLSFLGRYEFGGILADDMGLGKTVQVLAWLQHCAEQSGKPPRCLIVAPRSVIQNWQAEAAVFVPDLGVYVHHGPERSQNPADWPEAALIVTTYSTLRIDIETFKEIGFDVAVLDESHSMRNPASQTFKAVRLINARQRICLTGTPVQNTVMDLWTQFHFLNPGLIGNQAHFLNKWVKPIEKFENKEAGGMLQKITAPFILRRTKKKVAKDLPSLTSSIVHCPMEPKQRKYYDKHRQVYYEIINKTLDEKGVRESRFAVLEGLTKLRQICCSPLLTKSSIRDAAKINRFLELAEELISEGHRALVFSQFVKFLRLIETEVKKRKWDYEYLDGGTRDRQERVDRFQQDDSKKLFLISLKAGGEGLNLTAADYVFIMDPWWNPAAERQAMDRTHRIGQTENVFVYRLVCPDTVEEKILKLQERKQKLSDQLITAEAGIFKELDRKELLDLFA